MELLLLVSCRYSQPLKAKIRDNVLLKFNFRLGDGSHKFNNVFRTCYLSCQPFSSSTGKTGAQLARFFKRVNSAFAVCFTNCCYVVEKLDQCR